MRKRSRKRAVGSNPAWCYLCGLPIPQDIVSSRHPLFGTVDHVVARSRNGPDTLANRLPAHRLCNLEKGDHLIYPEEFAIELRQQILPMLESLGHKITEKAKRAAIRRVLKTWPPWAPTWRRETRRAAIDQWEDDGGSVLGAWKGDEPA